MHFLPSSFPFWQEKDVIFCAENQHMLRTKAYGNHFRNRKSVFVHMLTKKHFAALATNRMSPWDKQHFVRFLLFGRSEQLNRQNENDTNEMWHKRLRKIIFSLPPCFADEEEETKCVCLFFQLEIKCAPHSNKEAA